MLSDLGRLDISHLGMWLNFDGIRGHDDERLENLIAAAANLEIGAEHRAYVEELRDETGRTEAMALFTAIAHETRHFHDLLMTPYGSALIAEHMRAAFALQSALGSLAAAPVIVVPLREWNELLPVLRRVAPELEPPSGRLPLLAETLDETSSKLAELDRGILIRDAPLTATQILESSAYLIQLGLTGSTFGGVDAVNALDRHISAAGGKERYTAAIDYVNSRLGAVPFGALALLFLAALCGHQIHPDRRVLRAPVDVLMLMVDQIREHEGFPYDVPRTGEESLGRVDAMWGHINAFFEKFFGARVVEMMDLAAGVNDASVRVWEERVEPARDDSLASQRIEETLEVYRSYARVGRALVENFKRRPKWYLPDQYLDALPRLPRPLTFLWTQSGFPATPKLAAEFYIQHEVVIPREQPQVDPDRVEEFRAVAPHFAYDDGEAWRSAQVIAPKFSRPASPPDDELPAGVEEITLAAWRGYFDAVVPQLRLLAEGPQHGLPDFLRSHAVRALRMSGTRVLSRAGELNVPAPTFEELKRWDTRYPHWPSLE